MNNNYKVSVIIPVYNSEKYLKESIESALCQTYPNIEIIAINDGSTDHSLDILKQYENQINIINIQNKGLANAVNIGIKKISGFWMKWLSPDDVLKKNAVQTLVNEAKKISENTILYSNWEMIDEDGHKLRDFHESNFNDLDNFEFNVRLLDGQQININTSLIPSSLFKKGCLMQDLDDPVAIDYDFFLRSGMLYSVKFHLVENNLLKYRIHQKQISHQNISDSLKYLTEIRENILLKIDDKKRKQYVDSLKKYSKNKKIEKKTMEMGLKIVTKLLPNSISDKMLVFYLNKIRSAR